MGTKYDWGGTKIMPYPLTKGKRSLSPPTQDPIWMDMRDFIIPPNRTQIITAFTLLKVEAPTFEKKQGTFDEQARLCWLFLAGGNIEDQSTGTDATGTSDDNKDNGNTAGPSKKKAIMYDRDPTRQDGEESDFWQLPGETIARRAGDCEDLAILLASLMTGTGISPYCIRVVIGDYQVVEGGLLKESRSHAWVVYKAEQGQWCMIDPTWHRTMYKQTGWYLADGCDAGIQDSENPGRLHRYVPSYGFNCDHAWEITAIGPQ